MNLSSRFTDFLDKFLIEKCEFSLEYLVRKGLLYEAYRDYVMEKGLEPLSIRDFGEAMKRLPLITEKRTKAARMWGGVRLSKSDSEPEISLCSPLIVAPVESLPEENKACPAQILSILESAAGATLESKVQKNHPKNVWENAALRELLVRNMSGL